MKDFGNLTQKMNECAIPAVIDQLTVDMLLHLRIHGLLKNFITYITGRLLGLGTIKKTLVYRIYRLYYRKMPSITHISSLS